MTRSLQVLDSLQWHQPSKAERALFSSSHPGLPLLHSDATWCCQGRGLRTWLPTCESTRENSATKRLWPNRDVATRFPSRLGGKERSISVHSVDYDEFGLSPPLLAEAQFVVCGISDLFSWARNCTNHPHLSQLRTEANAGRLLAEEPNLPPHIIRISGKKIIHCLNAALSSNQAQGTPLVLL